MFELDPSLSQGILINLLGLFAIGLGGFTLYLNKGHQRSPTATSSNQGGILRTQGRQYRDERVSSEFTDSQTTVTLGQTGSQEESDPIGSNPCRGSLSPSLEEVLRPISEQVALVTGIAFFEVFVYQIASVLGVRGAIASRLLAMPTGWDLTTSRLQVLSVWGNILEQPHTERPLTHIPEELVYTQGVYYCPDRLQEYFPKDSRWRATEMSSFLGVALTDSQGRSLGSISLFSDRPFDDQFACTILKVFAGRTSAELERLSLEAALHTSEKKYQALISQIPAVTYIAPFDRGGLRFYLSQQLETILGYSWETWRTDPVLWSEFLHPEDRDRVQVEERARLVAKSGVDITCSEPSVLEYRAIASDGRIVWLRDCAVVVQDAVNQSLFLQGVLFDITESKATKTALQESEYRYYMLAKMLPVGIFRAETSGECLYVNERYCEMAGLTPAEALKVGWIKALHPDDRDRVLTEWYQAVTERVPFKLEYRFLKGDRVVWVFCQAVPEIETSGECRGYLGTLTDISDRKQAEEALQRAEEKYRSIFENAIEGIFQTTPDGQFLSANPALARICGYESAEELMGRLHNLNRQLYVEPNRRVQFVQLLDRQGFIAEFESQIYRADNTTIWVSENARAVRDSNGKLLYYEGTVEDITARKIAEEKLMHDALHDTLTSLPNRALFMERLGYLIELTKRRQDYLFAVLFIDLDRFKVVNDSLGHLVGDRLLVAIAHRLQTCLRAGDIVARLGGDEFAILLENIKDGSDAISVAERVQKELAQPFNLDEYQVFTSASIGIVCAGLSPRRSEFDRSRGGLLLPQASPEEEYLGSILYERPEDLLRDADAAMYHAKALGKARHEVFNLSMHTRAVALLQLENDLRRAVERQEFHLYYQPIVSLNNGTISGFEALLRWQHPQRGIVMPGEFIHIAEETRLIVPIGWWMLRTACQQMYQWQQQFPLDPPLTISVNLSNQQFTQPDLIERIRDILEETTLDPCSLKLEITESVIMENAESAAALLAQFRALGIQLYIDDFGTGYSSLSRLHTFPTDALKIDREFVSRMAEDEGNEAIVQTILILAGHLGMNVIAEGIETAEQLALLRALQCEYGQGYFFSKPLSDREATCLVSAQPQW